MNEGGVWSLFPCLIAINPLAQLSFWLIKHDKTIFVAGFLSSPLSPSFNL